MSPKIRLVVLAGVISLLTLPGPVQSQKSKAPNVSVFLTATFRDANDASGNPLDKLRSDGQGPYHNTRDLTVMINGSGELEFDIGKRSGRRFNLIFNDYLRYGSSAEQPPDTACIDPWLADEPVNEGHFTTHMEDYMADPKVNFLEMQAGETKEVRFWIVFTTAVRGYFYLGYNQLPIKISGYVMVQAIDTNNDFIVDRWILYPKPATDGRANLHRRSLSGKDREPYDLGDFKMPFELTLDRLK
jgi:hypothetical protein